MIALEGIAPGLNEESHLLGLLDPLRHGFEAQGLRHCNDSRNDCPIPCVSGDISGE